jgi:hypothetical protein
VKIHEKINDWLIPALLAFATYYLSSMSSEMTKISNSLAVALFRIENHEERIRGVEGEMKSGAYRPKPTR